MSSPLVDCVWLAEHLNDQNLVILDASMQHVVAKEPLVYEHFCCIPNAIACDIEQVFVDTNSAQVHTMPTAEQFTQAAQRLGINQDTVVVIYDNQGIYSAPRAWWMFKVMGFDKVYLLDGGLPQWQAQGYTISEQYGIAKTGYVIADMQTEYIKDAAQVLASIDDAKVQIIDARGPARFDGRAPEPRARMRSGHIPNSINLPFMQVLSGDCYLSAAEQQALFSDHNIDLNKQLIFSCGSGITACIILLAAVIAGANKVSLYDGSWAEWGADPKWPIA